MLENGPLVAYSSASFFCSFCSFFNVCNFFPPISLLYYYLLPITATADISFTGPVRFTNCHYPNGTTFNFLSNNNVTNQELLNLKTFGAICASLHDYGPSEP